MVWEVLRLEKKTNYTKPHQQHPANPSHKLYEDEGNGEKIINLSKELIFSMIY